MARILGNIAFRESRTWVERTRCICGPGESPDAMPAWRQAGRLLRGRAAADVVVTMGARVSLCYGLACAALGVDSKQVFFEVFLDAPKRRNPLWRLKAWVWRLVARRARGAVCAASGEAAALARRLGIPPENARFVPICTTVREPAAAPARGEPYALAAGRSWRDWATLFAAAPHFGMPLEVVAGKDDCLPETPAGVRVRREVAAAEYRALLAGAAVVAVPLLPAERSTGQVVLLEAMALGKPVVATRVTGTADYVRNGENGLLVPPGDAAALGDAVARLAADPALAARLGAAALEDAKTRFSPEVCAENLLAALEAFAR